MNSNWHGGSAHYGAASSTAVSASKKSEAAKERSDNEGGSDEGAENGSCDSGRGRGRTRERIDDAHVRKGRYGGGGGKIGGEKMMERSYLVQGFA